MDVRYALNPVGSLVGGTCWSSRMTRTRATSSARCSTTRAPWCWAPRAPKRLLSILRTVRPHAIITDIALPGRDGFWLLEQLRSSKRTEKIPMIALTAVAGREEIFDAGFDAFVSKPVRPEGVTHAVLAARGLRADPDDPPID